MKRPAALVIDGKRYLWRDILEMRRRQLEEARKAEQLALFEMKDDHRPAEQRTAAGRYQTPSLFTLLDR
jgi:hypothetical protein